MKRISELLCLLAVYAFVPGSEAFCGTAEEALDVSDSSAEFEFRLENTSNFSNASLWAIVRWNLTEADEAKLDGILVKLWHDSGCFRKKRFVPGFPFGPGPLVTPTSNPCDDVNENIWGVDENGTSVQCQVPCEEYMPKPCDFGRVCSRLIEGYTALSKESRSFKQLVEYGKAYDYTVYGYKDWNVADVTKIGGKKVIFCRHELVYNHGISEEEADRFCIDNQDIQKTFYTSGPVSNLSISEPYRNLQTNRGEVVVQWRDPLDVLPDAPLSSYGVSTNVGIPDKLEVLTSDKEKDGFYRVAVRGIKFGSNGTVQITPINNVSSCEGCDSTACTQYGMSQDLEFQIPGDIDFCLGDTGNLPYCDPIANCTDSTISGNDTTASCTCPSGYAGNGISTNYPFGDGCYDFDSCSDEGERNQMCVGSATCTDLPPPSRGVNCSCPANYIGDGYRSGFGCRDRSLIIGLAVGIPAVIIAILMVVAVVLKMRLQKKRLLDEKMSHFLTSAKVEYNGPIFTIANNHQEGAFGQVWELDRNMIELKGIIGRGNFGVVQKATLKVEDEEERLVAVKMTSENPSESLTAAFLSEISMIIQCGKHENLIGMIGCCTTADKPIYLVSEYMKYGDLLHFLWSSREEEHRNLDPIYNLNEFNIYQIASQVANGLKHLVDVKIIHGDIAARNILVGEGLQCKISDFGLANDVYRYGMIKGAIEKTVPLKWIAPERMMSGKVPITWRSDVWSFGILLYETITLGASPYPDVGRDELFDELQSGYRMSKPEYCSQYLYDIMLKCWQWAPSKRPSFKKLLEDLQPPSCNDSETYVNLIAVVPSLEKGNQNGFTQNRGYANNGVLHEENGLVV